MSAVKDRCSHRHAVFEVGNHFQLLGFIHRLNIIFILLFTVNCLQFGIEFVNGFLAALILFAHLVQLFAQLAGSPTEVRFQNLSDVHTGRHAQRVQYNVNRGAVFHIRHILQRQNAGNRTFVTVASGNLIAGLNFTLGRNEDFNHLQNARQQIIAALYFFNLVFKVFLNLFDAGVKSSQKFFDTGHDFFVFNHNLTPL